MPSVSKSQQRLMAQAYQVLKWKKSGGKEGLDPEEIEPRYRVEIEDLAASMTEKELKAYAETSHADLPNKVDEGSMTGFLSAGPFPKYTAYTTNVGPGEVAARRDRLDPLIKNFMEYIEGKNTDEDEDEVEENFSAPAAGAANTPGMGNVTPATANSVGSGDKFDNLGFSKKKKKKKRLEEGVALIVPMGTPQVNGTPGMGPGASPSSGNVDAKTSGNFDNQEDNLEDKVGIMSYAQYKNWLEKWLRQRQQK